MKQHHMIQKGDTLIVGVSGGADSICLLSVLLSLKESMDLTIICAHVNHMFRETALRDEEYVQELCKRQGICCRVKREDVSRIASEQKISFEEAGRNVRYAFFRELKEEFHADKIAVAHNKNDCAETMLFHLFRGSHLKGLGGICPVNDTIIRPLLNVERSEIESYLNANHITWQTDETNASTEYSRNYIRHEILPAAEKMCPGVNGRIAETASGLRDVDNYLEYQTKEAFGRVCKRQDGGVFINATALLQEHPVIVSRILYHVLEKESGTAKDLGKVHVRELTEAFGLQSGRQISLPGKVVAYRTAEGVLVRKETKTVGEEVALVPRQNGITSTIALISKQELHTGETVQFELEGLGIVKARLLFNYELKNIPQKTYTKWFDYDKITKCAVFRKRLEGDYLVIDDKGSRKKLKEYFIQEKIPSYKRDEIWILADDQHIIWIPGYRISAFYKVSDKTERILELTIGGIEDE